MIFLGLVLMAVLADWIMLLVIHPSKCLIPNGLSCWFGFYPIPNDQSMLFDFLGNPSPAMILALMLTGITFIVLVNLWLAKWKLNRAVQVGLAAVTIGAMSNTIQMLITGEVYDWIVIPAFGSWWIMTLGDIVIYLGAPTIVLCALRGLVREYAGTGNKNKLLISRQG